MDSRRTRPLHPFGVPLPRKRAGEDHSGQILTREAGEGDRRSRWRGRGTRARFIQDRHALELVADHGVELFHDLADALFIR
jgi:hypothetical protein